MTTTSLLPPARSTRRTRAAAVAAAVAAAALVWLIAVPLLDLAVTVPEGPGSTTRAPLGLALVLVTAAVASLAGWALLALLERLTRRAGAIWTGVALVVLVATMPYAPGFTATERVVLGAMHLAVAAVLVPGLRRGARRPEGEDDRPVAG